MLISVLYLSLLVTLSGLALAWTAARCRVETVTVSDIIDAVLPQTQCGRCGYRGCRPYADAMARQEADLNRCPPGGDSGIRSLADLLGKPYRPLDEAIASAPPTVVVIDEARCIGCTLCIQACPVDAIVGASKLMHTVIESECTGCNRCLPPCPVDCIEIVDKPESTQTPFTRRNEVAHDEMPCIRCGDCSRVCPEGLEPRLLHQLLGDGRVQTAAEAGLSACTDCGECDDVCPSRIPLLNRIRRGKHDHALASADDLSTARARSRFEERGIRIVRLQQEREAAMQRRKQLLADKAARQDRIRASIARAAMRSKPVSKTTARPDEGNDRQ